MKRFDTDTPIDVDSQVGNLAGLFGAMVALAVNSVAGWTETPSAACLTTNLSVNPGTYLLMYHVGIFLGTSGVHSISLRPNDDGRIFLKKVIKAGRD